MDVTKLSDLELAKVLSEQQDLLNQAFANVKILKDELAKRLNKKEVDDESKED